jgi:hypothetical protein
MPLTQFRRATRIGLGLQFQTAIKITFSKKLRAHEMQRMPAICSTVALRNLTIAQVPKNIPPSYYETGRFDTVLHILNNIHQSTHSLSKYILILSFDLCTMFQEVFFINFSNHCKRSHMSNTGWSKSLCAPDDYSTKNTQNYFKQFKSLTMTT